MYDVAILGAGPAGAALACALAPRWRVVLIDKRLQPGVRIGEALVPAAGRVLRDLGLRAAFDALAPAPYVANRSFWGSANEDYRDFISDPEGCGWHLNRAAFERMLRAQASARGAECLFRHQLQDIAPGWRLRCGGIAEISCRFVVDATGRSAALARRLGARRQPHDRMVARWCRLQGGDQAQRGISSVIATPNGWWYHLAGQRKGRHEDMLAFHSLPDLMPPYRAADLLHAAQQHPGLSEPLHAAKPLGEAKTSAAHTGRLDRASGPSWLAIGDAAVCFDPIASRGLFHALYSAFVAAALLDERLRGIGQDFSLYDADISRIYTRFLAHRRAVYSAEQRWPETVFWQEAQHGFPLAKHASGRSRKVPTL